MEVKYNSDPDLIPEYATEHSAGLDLKSSIDIIIPLHETRLIPTSLKIQIPEGYEGQIRLRSSLGLKGLFIPNSPGTIDSDYRGEVKVILHNLNNTEFKISKGMRIAQLVICKYEKVRLIKSNLDVTERNTGGFGSTGI